MMEIRGKPSSMLIIRRKKNRKGEKETELYKEIEILGTSLQVKEKI